ncbi:MAG: sigma-70 family RNA polymerase sigma factor [Alphaproteobacteria bacterium]|nr:sigma-70 family RNA polymerase sigma factor [Alphaproteobacteria bacterium]
MADEETKSWFSERIDEYADPLYGYSFQLTRNRTDAEDLVADAVSKAWSGVESLKDRRKFRSWIFRILHNCYVSNYRKKSVRPVEVSQNVAFDEITDDLTNFLTEQSDEFLAWWGTPEREFANKVLGEDILEAIEGLPDEFKGAVVLVTVEGLSYNEAAEVLEISSGTVHSRMKRGRMLLQKALWIHATEAGLITETPPKEMHNEQ